MASMKLLICLLLGTLCVHLVQCFVFEVSELEIANSDSDSFEDYDLEARKCQCDAQSGCLCVGKKSGYKVEAFISLDELARHGHEHILVHFNVNGVHFVHRFCANKRRFFCHSINDKQYCFVFKVHDDGKEKTLPGCIRMVKPVNINLGCFSLPL